MISACAKTDIATAPRRLTIAVPRDAGNLTPYTAGDAHDDFMLELIYDKLCAPSPYVKAPKPWLAEEIRRVDGRISASGAPGAGVSDAGRTWDVRVRSGIRWHDGVPFTAEDIEFTFEYYRDGPVNRWTHHTSKVPKIADAFLVDSSTVRITCADPCPAFDRVTAADLPIIPKHIWRNVTSPRTFDSPPVGTGPFVWVQHVPDQFYRFRANRDYFKGAPGVDELILTIVKDPSTTFLALKTGEVAAAARSLPPELIKPFQKMKNLRVVRTSALSGVEALLNYRKFPFENKDFRKALNLAVDRRPILQSIVLGFGKSGHAGYPHPASHWTRPGTQIVCDTEQAKTILDELGLTDQSGDGFRDLPDGRPFEITMMVASNEPDHLRAAEMLAPQFGRIGLKARTRSIDPGSVKKYIVTMEFDIAISHITPHSLADPDQFVMSHKSGYLWKEGLPYPEMDARIERWRKAEAIEARKAAGFGMQEFFNEYPTSLILYYPDEYWAFRPADFDRWAEAPGQGIIHKWSFLTSEARSGIVTDEFGR